MKTLIDSNIILDVLTESPHLADTAPLLGYERAQRRLAVNPIVWAEVAPQFESTGEQTAFFEGLYCEKRPLPFEAGRIAGLAHLHYRRQGGSRLRTLPDFFIGAQAVFENLRVLTRDVAVYRHYFPGVELLVPGGEV